MTAYLGHTWKRILFYSIVIIATLYAVHRTADWLITHYQHCFGFDRLGVCRGNETRVSRRREGQGGKLSQATTRQGLAWVVLHRHPCFLPPTTCPVGTPPPETA